MEKGWLERSRRSCIEAKLQAAISARVTKCSKRCSAHQRGPHRARERKADGCANSRSSRSSPSGLARGVFAQVSSSFCRRLVASRAAMLDFDLLTVRRTSDKPPSADKQALGSRQEAKGDDSQSSTPWRREPTSSGRRSPHLVTNFRNIPGSRPGFRSLLACTTALYAASRASKGKALVLHSPKMQPPTVPRSDLPTRLGCPRLWDVGMKALVFARVFHCDLSLLFAS